MNLTFGRSPSNLTITKVEITNLSGSWDLTGNPGKATGTALSPATPGGEPMQRRRNRDDRSRRHRGVPRGRQQF